MHCNIYNTRLPSYNSHLFALYFAGVSITKIRDYTALRPTPPHSLCQSYLCCSRRHPVYLGHLSEMENVRHASEDGMSAPAGACGPAVMVSGLKNERVDRMCQKCPSSCWDVPFFWRKVRQTVPLWYYEDPGWKKLLAKQTGSRGCIISLKGQGGGGARDSKGSTFFNYSSPVWWGKMLYTSKTNTGRMPAMVNNCK